MHYFQHFHGMLNHIIEFHDSLCVLLNCCYVWIVCHTNDMRMAFLRYVHACAFSGCHVGWMFLSHWLHRKGLMPVCMCLCRFKLETVVKYFWHSSHWYGFFVCSSLSLSLEWLELLRCFSNPLEREKLLWQWKQTKGRSLRMNVHVSFQVAKFCELLQTLVAIVHLFSGMYFHVFFQATVMFELFLTHATSIWLFLHMNSHVHVQITVQRELLRTEATTPYARSTSAQHIVLSHMRLQLASTLERLCTLLTPKSRWICSRVNCCVLFQIVHTWKLPVAMFATERTNIGMHRHMSIQTASTTERTGTLTATE